MFLREQSPPTNNLTLGFGAHRVILGDSSPVDMNEVRLAVDEIIVHPSYIAYTLHVGIHLRNNLNLTLSENDIAVLKVKNGEKLKCVKKIIWPVCLPTKEESYAGWDRTILSGWGRVVGGENITTEPRTLRKVSLPIISGQECDEYITPVANFTDIGDKHICARDDSGRKSGCQGDSGGPLVAANSEGGGYSVVGIVSWGSPVCDPSYANIYTRVGQYMEWIGSQFGLLPPE